MKKIQWAAALLTLAFATPAFPCDKPMGKQAYKEGKERMSHDHQIIRGLLTQVSDKMVALTTSEGYTYTFKLGKKIDVTVAHLKEHMAKKEPVSVHFTGTGKAKKAVKITD